MRKWFEDYCMECVHDAGYWEDVVEGIATLRKAARLMRERAEAAFVPWHGWGDKSLPQRSGVEEWKADMNGYLGGEWGEHAASWHPVVALGVAHWLDMEALIQFGRDKNGEIAMRSDTFDCALAVAKAYLAENAPARTPSTKE